jgi:glyoxylate carboligase
MSGVEVNNRVAVDVEMTEFSVGLGPGFGIHSQAQGAMPRLREQLPELGRAARVDPPGEAWLKWGSEVPKSNVHPPTSSFSSPSNQH